MSAPAALTASGPVSAPRAGRLRRFAQAVFSGFRLLALLLDAARWPASARRAVAHELHRLVWRGLPAHALGLSLLTLVLARLIDGSAASYGLSHVAAATSLRVVLVELVPLYAVLFVAWGLTPLQTTANADAPAALARALAVWVLASFGVALALPLCFLSLHGTNLWAWDGYARRLAEVFGLHVGLGLLLKTGAFALAAALAPAMRADTPDDPAQGHVAALARLLAAVLGAELLALALLVT